MMHGGCSMILLYPHVLYHESTQRYEDKNPVTAAGSE